MNKTRSILFESIQHSPIDPIMMDETSGGLVTPELVALLEERPLPPPCETRERSIRVRLLNPQAWVDQIGSAGIKGHNSVVVTRSDSSDGGITVTRASDGQSMTLSADGSVLKHRGELFQLSDQVQHFHKIPVALLQMLTETYEAISAWRSRVVRLSMDTDDYDCSLMDDLCPPRTFLAEFKFAACLKSVRIQAGVAHWQMLSGKIVSVPVKLLEQQESISKFMHRLTPELETVDVSGIWSDLIQLRGMCLDEDRRLISRLDVRAPIAGG